MFIILAFLILSFLVFFHELGHYIVARICGVRVETFSIGFGKKIICKTYRGTDYALSLIPLGGYVKLKGQSDLNPLEKDEAKDSYSAKKPLIKIAILFAGPLFNFILAFVIYLSIALYGGIEGVLPIVGEVKKDMPAFVAGLKEGDQIININQKKIRSWNEVHTLITSEAQVDIEVMRQGKKLSFSIPTQVQKRENVFGEMVDIYVIGIVARGDAGIIYQGFLDSIYYAFMEFYKSSKMILMGIQKMLIGVVSLKEIGGPIMIVDSIANFAQKDLTILFLWVALISVNLGILNLLPIPALDGGQIFFNLYEILTGRVIHEQGAKYLTLLGWVVLFGLMLLGIFNDLTRIFGA
ncbi:RIP metalloprotease RseP [Helicobacter sp. faydin-H20]|uniref:RIP metalloprotease RseP n=1 Tax=Helicobacter anatolicus TaxID=2905874 RepID=UPI001E35F5B0|nr:RIP metalloprotease RseP [Helicobacter anatolicus]MCE3036498.1 RIP metalloprotease RseP [Helicobacter anatolicus]